MTQNFENAHSQPATLYESMINNDPDIINSIHHDEDRIPNLKWDSYHKYCQVPLQKPGNRINPQLKCAQLSGAKVRWEGSVTSVEIHRLDNYLERLLTAYIPEFLLDMIMCWYGDLNEVSADASDTTDYNDIKSIFKQKKRCNLDMWNTYVFDVTVKMSSGLLTKPSEIILRAPNTFTNFTKYLNHSDRIWFKGIVLKSPKVDPNVGDGNSDAQSDKIEPLIDLTAVGCISCSNDKLEATAIAANHFKLSDRIKDLRSGFKYLLNVLFNPVIIFK